MKDIWNIIVIFIIVIILHILAILFGWYKTDVVWIDNAQHILAGFAFAMLFFTICKKVKNKKYLAIYAILFVLLTSIIWELFELALSTLIPVYAKQFSLYSPNFTEGLEDVISNLIGGVIFTILYLIKNK